MLVRRGNGQFSSEISMEGDRMTTLTLKSEPFMFCSHVRKVCSATVRTIITSVGFVIV